jgi:hypothetical protein
MQPAGPASCVRPPGPACSTTTALLRLPATSTSRLSGETATSSGEASPRAVPQPKPPWWLTQPSGPAAWVTLPSAARSKIAIALGKRRPATYTRSPSGLTATLVGSLTPRAIPQPSPGSAPKHPVAPGSCVTAPVRRLRWKTLRASLPAEAT